MSHRHAAFRCRYPVLLLLCLMEQASISILSAAEPNFPEVQLQKTASGIPFAFLGQKPSAPAPTLFVFGGEMRSSLISEDVNKLGRLLTARGYFCVALDVPAHGVDARDGEKPGDLRAWKARIVQGENLAADCASHMSQVLDFLIQEGYTDPQRVAISGTSRGGFIALHCAAADARIKQVIAFAPVTHLPVLTEFAGEESNPKVLAQSVIHVADKLVGKPLLMIIGNDDSRVGTAECLALGLEIVRQSKGKSHPIPVEIRLVGTIAHRLHASPTPQYGQRCAPHDEAAAWLLAQPASAVK